MRDCCKFGGKDERYYKTIVSKCDADKHCEFVIVKVELGCGLTVEEIEDLREAAEEGRGQKRMPGKIDNNGSE